MTGREERYDGFEGEPRSVSNALGGSGTTGSGIGGHSSGTAGPHNSNLENKIDPRVDSDLDGSRNMGASRTGAGGYDNTSSGLGGTNTGSGYDNTTTTTGKKPGLMDRINPMKDTDGDGKKGVMD